MRRLASSLLLTALLVLPASAQEIDILQRSGSWETFGGYADDGSQVCGVSTSGSNNSFMIKYFNGDDYLVGHVKKIGWKIPEGTSIDIEMKFDRYPEWSAVGTGYTDVIEFYIPLENVAQFLEEFARSMQMIVSFPKGDEGYWTGDLRGSSKSLDAMSTCMDYMIDAAPTNPFDAGSKDTTQPFESTTSPAPAAPQAVDPKSLKAAF